MTDRAIPDSAIADSATNDNTTTGTAIFRRMMAGLTAADEPLVASAAPEAPLAAGAASDAPPAENAALRHARTLAGHASALARRALDCVVPPLCLGCRRPLVEPRALCGPCWSSLELIGAPICPILGTPLAFDAGPGARSPELRWNHPLYDRARAAAVFGPMSRKLVHDLKFRDTPGVAALMARLMVPAVREITDGADYLVPVPLHRWRLVARRFNQAVALADALGPLVGVPVARAAVRRIRATPHQVGLSRTERADNLHGAFRVADPGFVAGRTLVVVDDVLTTGATADAMALALQAAGARSVRVAVFARVVGDAGREPH